MNQLRISTPRIQGDAQKIEELNEAIPGLIRDLEAGMKKLSTCWEGPAWGAYQTTVAGYIETLSEIYQTMTQYASHISEAGQIYHRAEQDVCMKVNTVIVL